MMAELFLEYLNYEILDDIFFLKKYWEYDILDGLELIMIN
jgi:hypothetical protein